MNKVYLVWLEWPEKCFRADAEALRRLKGLLPKGSCLVCARSETAFLRYLPRATHAIVWHFKQEWFARAPRLKVLATPAAGRELVSDAAPPAVKVHYGHFHGAIMSETVAAFVLAWSRGFFAAPYAPKTCRAWPRTWLADRCREVAGTKAVVVGYGHIGRAIGEKLMSLGVSVTGLTRHGVYCGASRRRMSSASVRSYLRSADWLVLALPSTTGTDDFLNAALIRQLPRRCVVINVGRGNAVDERALAAALKNGRLAGAFLDVRKFEPSGTAPRFGENVAALSSLPNCVTLPHAAAFSPRYLIRCFEELKNDRCL